LGEVFAHVHAVAIKRHSSMQNWLFGLPGRILCEQCLLMSKKMMSMLFSLLFTCLTFFSLGEFWLAMYGSCFIPQTLV
jgi:hypothetical protein